VNTLTIYLFCDKIAFSKYKYMNSRDIVRKAWQITQVHLKKLIWYGAVPSFFTVLVSSVYMAYQYHAFKTSALFSDTTEAHVFDTAKTGWELASGHVALTIILIILAIIVIFCYVILPPIFNGTLIQAIMRIHKFEPIDGSVEVGVRRFFPMFEFGILTGSFSITTLFTESSFILRWWGESIFFVTLPILLFIAVVGIIVTFLFTYSEYFIVLKGLPLVKSVIESSVLVISNLRRTVLIFILMLLISVRIILNVLLVLIIPMSIVFLTSYFATSFYTIVGLVLFGIFGIGVLLVSSYLLGLFHIFATAVWVLTFAIIVDKERPKIRDVDLGKDNFSAPEGLSGNQSSASPNL